jgi:aspartate/methionine/tyrosine aminotransferase
MTQRTRVVSVTNRHNPTGMRMSDDVVREVARVAAKGGAYLVVDEVYAPFDAFVDDRGQFPGSARHIAPNVVAVSSLTKCYGLGAHRIGWLLAPAEIAARARDVVTACHGALPLAHAHLGVHAFARVHFLAARARSILRGKREYVAAWVNSMAESGLAWSGPAEGLFGLVTVPGDVDLTPVIEAAARDRDVLVAAGAFFGVPNGFRVAWSSPIEALDEGLGRFGEVLKARLKPPT